MYSTENENDWMHLCSDLYILKQSAEGFSLKKKRKRKWKVCVVDKKWDAQGAFAVDYSDSAFIFPHFSKPPTSPIIFNVTGKAMRHILNAFLH